MTVDAVDLITRTPKSVQSVPEERRGGCLKRLCGFRMADRMSTPSR